MLAGILGRLGAGPPRRVYSPLIDVFHRAKGDPEERAMFDALTPLYTEWLQTATAEVKPGEKIDPRPFLVEAEKLGEHGVRMAIELLELNERPPGAEPLGRHPPRRVGRRPRAHELFRSENLETAHGEYFDQRFVDFLAAYFDDVDEINWRQFEGLAAEFFARQGFLVELGPGRADGGVDIRLWPTTPPADCHRQCSSSASASSGASRTRSSRRCGPTSSTRAPRVA